ncbi:uncharacterized protein LOC115318406 [Ixodes scapularis]|uniref:uncharacterized protein LOC115318406 n=1 Tax=Ixodes scapularis TaxID=6945 RepID=UPI001A9F330B|nr:uncharacterized protein LOC115318406 [Ixodes scapularis]
MFAFLFSVAVVVGVHYTFASTSYPDENPALQEYQNEAAAFPLEEQWYMMYRNYESDPFFGDKAKCVSITETKPGENGAYPVVLRYNPDVSIDLTATFSSSPGYTVKNIVIHHNQDQNVTIASRTAYKDVKKCDVLRMPQAGGACVLLVPKSQLGSVDKCCDFIFDLLCGATPKFNIYDSSCS